jgi:hypothetical protein
MTDLINAISQTSEKRHQVFLLKKRIADIVVVEVRIDENREINVKFRTDFLNHAGQFKKLTILSMQANFENNN